MNHSSHSDLESNVYGKSKVAYFFQIGFKEVCLLKPHEWP
jgi:hypothetical protein